MSPVVEYSPVHSDDEELHLNDKKSFIVHRSSKGRTILLYFGIFALGFAGGILGNLVVGNVLKVSNEASSSPSPIPGNIFSPKLPTVMRPDERYIGWSRFANQNWQSLVKSSESVWIAHPDRYHLTTGFESPMKSSSQPKNSSQFYHISNLHQLHCLNILRIGYYHSVHNITQATPDDDANAAYHVEHCVEYLRQSITCGSHFDIEPSSPPGTPPSEIADRWGNPLGWGITKNCINWNNLMTWQRQQLEASGLAR